MPPQIFICGLIILETKFIVIIYDISIPSTFSNKNNIYIYIKTSYQMKFLDKKSVNITALKFNIFTLYSFNEIIAVI